MARMFKLTVEIDFWEREAAREAVKLIEQEVINRPKSAGFLRAENVKEFESK